LIECGQPKANGKHRATPVTSALTTSGDQPRGGKSSIDGSLLGKLSVKLLHGGFSSKPKKFDYNRVSNSTNWKNHHFG